MAAPTINHVAIRTNDLEKYLAFFTDVMGMEIQLTDPADGTAPLKQVWVGGVQIQRDESFDHATALDGQMSHFGVEAEPSEIDALLDRVYAYEGVTQAEGHERNWFVYPGGPMIEVVPRDADIEPAKTV